MNNIILFESKDIRRIWNEEDQKWYFSVIDVIAALTDSVNPRDYGKSGHPHLKSDSWVSDIQ